ncbi:hypothetical protein P167DRAFT_366905 [Morchella conica CCBAS932]|uniref:Uncharacterized protein n=1 Tax=Morchella conica CCBAS932 TaxID=1392247 RepID=A0A3N4KFD5_9PEZI|nr:hypothetical protein P167DRAFT_366905 [Morchella conica CCBAS932]
MPGSSIANFTCMSPTSQPRCSGSNTPQKPKPGPPSIWSVHAVPHTHPKVAETGKKKPAYRSLPLRKSHPPPGDGWGIFHKRLSSRLASMYVLFPRALLLGFSSCWCCMLLQLQLLVLGAGAGAVHALHGLKRQFQYCGIVHVEKESPDYHSYHSFYAYIPY